MRDTLYVTSFGLDFWKATSIFLLDSHRTSGTHYPLLACYEGAIPFGSRKPAYVYDLAGDSFLQDWLIANHDVIPTHLGGLAEPCGCPNNHVRYARHAVGCHYSWMNRNAARWFRKVVSWRYASQVLMPKIGARRMIWLDSDCLILRHMPEKTIDRCLRGTGMAYMYGGRHMPETGVVIFDTAAGGSEIIAAVCEHYRSGAFRHQPQWDDCWSLMTVLKAGGFAAADLVRHPESFSGNRVLPHTVLAKYFVHRHGTHGRRLNIVK